MIKILSTRQVAERLGVSTRTLARWRARGVGPKFFTVGRTVRYPTEQVEKFEKGVAGGRDS